MPKFKLNKSQQKAVNFGYGSLLVIAGAGTGKTKVITQRIKRLINLGVNHNQIVALTFTDKSAYEMLERLGDIMPLGYYEPYVMTFHKFCDRILKTEALEVGLDPNFKIITQPQQWMLIRKNLFNLKLDYFRPLSDPTNFITAILKFISRLQDENVDYVKFKKFVSELNNNKTSNQVEIKKWQELSHIYESYQKLKLEQSKMDFGDLIMSCINLFNDRPNILEKYQKQFIYILVDEFQDTNFAQYQLVKMLFPNNSLKNRSLMVVGDDSQSIYKFRGAAISNILLFKNDYPKSKMVTLIENYRSNQHILDSSYNLIQNNNPDTLESKLGISKKLVSKVDLNINNNVKPQILYLQTLADEIEQIMIKISEIINQDNSLTFKDIAILARANNHLDPIILALRRYNFPYQLVGNKGLYDRNEVRNVIALCKVLINPFDSISMFRVLSIESLNLDQILISQILSNAKSQRVNLWDIVLELNNHEIEFFKDTIKKYQQKISKYLPHQLIFEMVNSINYLSTYLDNETIENNLCIKNLNLFLEKVKNFENEFYQDSKEIPTIIDFVDYLEIMLESGENPAQAEIEDVDTINLMTIHSSKGLEFEVVFVINAVSDRIPSRNIKDRIMIPKELISETLPTGDEHIQEERRLFYVAMTRAKKYLFLTLAKNYEGIRDKRPSGFLNETGLPLIYTSEPIKSNEQNILFGINFINKVNQSLATDNDFDKISYSKLDKYNNCPLSYKYEYILNVPVQKNPSTSFGESMHKTLNDYHNKKSFGINVSFAELCEIFKKNWVPIGHINKDHSVEHFKNGLQMLENYYNKHNNESIKHKGLEKEFEIKLGDTKLVGKIDRIDILPSGNVELIDYKTGKVKDQNYVDKDEQLAIYTLGATQGLGLSVEKLSYYYIEEGVKISTTKTKEQLQEVQKKAIETINKIKKSKFVAQPGIHCSWCSFKDICPSAYK